MIAKSRRIRLDLLQAVGQFVKIFKFRRELPYEAALGFAGLTQLVECHLPKVKVASSSLVSRSMLWPLLQRPFFILFPLIFMVSFYATYV